MAVVTETTVVRVPDESKEGCIFLAKLVIYLGVGVLLIRDLSKP